MEISIRWLKCTLNRYEIGGYGINNTYFLHWLVGLLVDQFLSFVMVEIAAANE